jgi:hypothetical protein
MQLMFSFWKQLYGIWGQRFRLIAIDWGHHFLQLIAPDYVLKSFPSRQEDFTLA